MNNRVCETLGIQYPIIQGPMAWLSNAELVAAVSNAGGLGILGPNAGQKDITTDAIETAERMRAEIRKVMELTDKPFAVTLIGSNGEASSEFTLKILDVVIEEKVPAVLINSVGTEGYYGVEKGLLEPCKRHGIKMVVRAWQASIADAKKCEEQGVDVYVATGFDEGGTIPGTAIGTFSILPMIRDAIEMPLAVAGGITDIRTVRAAFALGAEAVFCGTLFIPVKESPAAQNVKELIVNSNAEDLVLYRAPIAYYRSLPTAIRPLLIENDQKLGTTEAIEANGKIMGGTSGLRIGMLEGDLEKGYVSVGNGVSFIHKIKTVQEVVDDLMVDFR